MKPAATPTELAIIALGSNQGDSPALFRSALDRMQQLAAGPLRFSGFWATTPVDCPPGSPPFLNAVAVFPPRPETTPASLLRQLQALEREFGRRPKLVLNEPRPLDLDLIVFGDQQSGTPELILPHPRAHERRFVLQPLAELLPDLRLPGQTATVAELLAMLPPDPAMRRREGP